MLCTIKDCLKLPCLKNSKVIAGFTGLGSIVRSVSVMEFFSNDEFNDYTPNEIIITAFYSYSKDVNKQCEAIRYLKDTGAIALIIFYSTEIMGSISPQVCDLANTIGLPLIVLDDKKDTKVKYSDIIMQVTSMIYEHKDDSLNLVNIAKANLKDILIENRNFDSYVKNIAVTFKCSIIIKPIMSICSRCYDYLYRGIGVEEYNRIKQLNFNVPSDYKVLDIDEELFSIKGINIGGEICDCIVISKKGNLLTEQTNQIKTLLEEFENIWGNRRYIRNRINAIYFLLKEGIGYEIGKCLQLDTNDKLKMIVISGHYYKDKKSYANKIKELFDSYELRYDCSLIDGNYIFLIACKESNIIKEIGYRIERIAYSKEKETINIFCSEQVNDLDALYDEYKEFLKFHTLLERVYDKKRTWNRSYIKAITNVLESSSARKEWKNILNKLVEYDLCDTLATYLIDADAQAYKASGIMSLHRNTIRYRLMKIEEVLDCSLDCLPIISNLYFVMILWRIQNSDK